MIRALLMLTLLQLLLLPTAQADARRNDDWEFGVRVGGMITDTALRLDGSAEVLTITRNFGAKRALELEIGADQLDFRIDYGLRHRTVSLNYLEINREPLWACAEHSLSGLTFGQTRGDVAGHHRRFDDGNRGGQMLRLDRGPAPGAFLPGGIQNDIQHGCPCGRVRCAGHRTRDFHQIAAQRALVPAVQHVGNR